MKRGNRILIVALELAVLVLVVAGVHAWRTRDLLPAGDRTAAPAFEWPLLEGGVLDSTELTGRPAVLYFFAPWCQVCAASAHQLRWFRRMTGDSIAVVLVALDWQSASEVAEYVQRHRLTLPVAMGNVAAREEFRIRGYPTYYVLDSQGRVASADVGLSTAPGLWLRTRGLE